MKTTNNLWTRDFTIITVGSVISMLGNSLVGFAMSLLVLDLTQSSLYYAIYMITFTFPQLVMPIFSGAILDRFSRKKMIYTLDFISAAFFISGTIIIHSGHFNFLVLAIACFVLGSINSIYMVAYDSFYPLLITEGNFSKAYSIASTLETLSAVMVPLSAYVYNLVGIEVLFLFNAVSFLIAAILETQIKTEEKYVETQKETEKDNHPKQMFEDIIEGFKYIASEKGLLAIACYFGFSAMAGGCSQVITLPYFKGNFDNGEYIYMLVWGMAIIGRSLGGLIHYKVKLPEKRKFAIALFVYCTLCLLEGTYLFTPVPVMMVVCFCTGILGVTSYTIRISATQSYIPDEKKGRFNGVFAVIMSSGSLIGEVLAGGLTTALNERMVLMLFMGINLLAAIFIIGANRRHVKVIYNTTN